MITLAQARALDGKRVLLTLDPATGEREMAGTCIGHVDAADGLVLIMRPDADPTRRASIHYQHVVAAQPY